MLFKPKDKNIIRINWKGIKSTGNMKVFQPSEQRQEEAVNKTELKHKTQLV